MNLGGKSVGKCVTANAGGSVSLSKCRTKAGDASQQWTNLRAVRRTIAQIVKAGTDNASCLATDGTTLILEPCAVEPPLCFRSRCTNSPRVRQLWYMPRTSDQLLSSFTNISFPPLDRATESDGSAPAFVGPRGGLPEPDLLNRRCGNCCGANDTASAMCAGATADGRLALLLADVEARCAADAKCVGFGQFSGGYFRPVTEITALRPNKGQWKSWWKRGYYPPPSPPPGPPAPSPPPPGPRPGPPPPPHSLVNVPLCMATAPNLSPPQPPQPPKPVNQHMPLTIWAGKMSKNRVAVVLLNSGRARANVTVQWSDIWLPRAAQMRVRDAVKNVDQPGTAAGSLTAEVDVHDVGVFVLTRA